jgi:hypothetical protein
VQTDRTIPNNKPDIVIRDNENGTYMLIDVVVPVDRNVIQKGAEKILKYKDLTIEIQHMWNVKTRVIPVIIGATLEYIRANAGASDMDTINSSDRIAATLYSLGT